MAQIRIIPESIELLKISDEKYFNNYKDYISNSGLSLINPEEDGSFEKFSLGIRSEYSDSFALGSAIHAMLLQPENYIIAEITKPNAKLGIFAEELYKFRNEGLPLHLCIPLASEKADYYSGKLTGNRLKTALKGILPFYLQRMNYQISSDKETIFLSNSIKEKFDKCFENIKNAGEFNKILFPEGIINSPEIFNEYAIFCEIEYVDTDTGEITNIKIKAKLDNFTINHESNTVTLNDLKTTGKPVNYFMGNFVNSKLSEEPIWYNGSFQYYHYYRQMAIYSWLLKSALKYLYDLEYTINVNMLVIETIPEFNSKVYPLNGKQIKYGLDEFKSLLSLVVQWRNLRN